MTKRGNINYFNTRELNKVCMIVRDVLCLLPFKDERYVEK